MKKEYKKILVDGEKIQKKFDDGNDGEIWIKQVYKTLDKYNLNNTNIYLVNYNGKKRPIELEDIFEHIASKNLSSIYLNNNNNILFKNEYGVEIEIIKEITQEEYFDLLDGE